MKKCSICGNEGESNYCAECGAPMEEVAEIIERTCPACGRKVESKFCPNCGFDMSCDVKEEEAAADEYEENSEENENETEEQSVISEPDTPVKKKSGKTVIIVMILAVVLAVIIGVVIVICTGLGVLGDMEGNHSEKTYDSYENSADSGDIQTIENQGVALAGGRYVVGEDLSAGKYTIIYKTNLSKDDYWTIDYLWITYKGSEGANETLGGDKFDDRYGGITYDDAIIGKSFFVILHDGDTLKVDNQYGEWTY